MGVGILLVLEMSWTVTVGIEIGVSIEIDRFLLLLRQVGFKVGIGSSFVDEFSRFIFFECVI